MGDRGTPAGDPALEAALDELYAAQFATFVTLRRALSVRLGAAGDAAAARRLAKAPKPTRTAWALNQVTRNDPEIVADVIRCREAAASAQTLGESAAIRDGARQYRESVGKVVQAVRTLLGVDGIELSSTQARRVGETLQALASSELGRATWMAGRLTRDMEVDDPFAGIEIGTAPHRAKERMEGRGQKTSKVEDEERARALEAERASKLRAVQREVVKAHARVTELDGAVSAARKTVLAAEREARRAQYDLDKARRAVTELERKLALSHADLEKIKGAYPSPDDRERG